MFSPLDFYNLLLCTSALNYAFPIKTRSKSPQRSQKSPQRFDLSDTYCQNWPPPLFTHEKGTGSKGKCQCDLQLRLRRETWRTLEKNESFGTIEWIKMLNHPLFTQKAAIFMKKTRLFHILNKSLTPPLSNPPTEVRNRKLYMRTERGRGICRSLLSEERISAPVADGVRNEIINQSTLLPSRIKSRSL